MPNFKPKNTKKFCQTNPSLESLDSIHENMLNDFNKKEIEDLPELIKKRDILLSEFNGSTCSFEDKLDIKYKIRGIDKLINNIRKNKKSYLLNNSKYIFDYFQTKKEISEGSSNIKKLDTFFNLNIPDNSNNSQSTKKNIQMYLNNVKNNHLDIDSFVKDHNVCRSCNKGELIPIEHEGILVCNNCSRNTRFLIENDKPSYKEPPKEVCFYAYKRINHFREILAQFQAKETTLIPEEIITNIKLQIKKERLEVHTMDNKRTKEILKKLGYNKYYEHIPFIRDKLGIKPPVMSQDLEESLCNLFMDIQVPYARNCPEDRVNFLNYYYTIYKLCELLNQKQFLPYFPMLKDREKRIEQDAIWKCICEELNWKFIPTK